MNGMYNTPKNIISVKTKTALERSTNMPTVVAAKITKTPIVGSITTPIQHQNPLKQMVMSAIDRMTVGLFGVCQWDAIVSLDHMVHKYVKDLYGKKALQRTYVIPFGARIESMEKYERSESKTAKPQILMVGHVHPFRNPVNLIRAIPLILREIPQARLLIVGRMDLQEPVRVARDLGLIEKHVFLMGEAGHDQVIKFMKQSHVFATWGTCPYLGLGTAAMEAMLCELPVVQDVPENLFGVGKLNNGENIVLVDSRNPQSIADAIVRLLKDENLRNKIGTGGRRFVLDHLSWENIAKQMEALYENILKERSSS